MQVEGSTWSFQICGSKVTFAGCEAGAVLPDGHWDIAALAVAGIPAFQIKLDLRVALSGGKAALKRTQSKRFANVEVLDASRWPKSWSKRREVA